MMNRKVLVLTICLVALTSMSCGSRRELSPDGNVVEAKGAMKVWAAWLKDKGKKFDVQLVVENLSDEGALVYLGEMRCGRGNMSGRLKHTFFNTGERTIDFRPHEQKTFNMVCLLGSASRGDFSVTIANVYDNKSGDGRTAGKPIAKDLKWILPEKDAN